MRVQATKAFRDLEAGCNRARGEEFEASNERGERLVSLKLAREIEQPEKPKPVRRRTARKPKEQ